MLEGYVYQHTQCINIKKKYFDANCVETDFVTQQMIFDAVLLADPNALEHFLMQPSSES